jgi:hypothetical protein
MLNKNVSINNYLLEEKTIMIEILNEIILNQPPTSSLTTPSNTLITSNMTHFNTRHLPLYEGDEDPKRHWFICDKKEMQWML